MHFKTQHRIVVASGAMLEIIAMGRKTMERVRKWIVTVLAMRKQKVMVMRRWKMTRMTRKPTRKWIAIWKKTTNQKTTKGWDARPQERRLCLRKGI